MYCVIQEIELKKPNKCGHPKELISEYMQTSFQGQDCSRYYHRYSQERFDRPIKKAYKISIHQSHRENGKVIKKQYPLCTVNYYDIVDGWFNLYDYCNKKIEALSANVGMKESVIYDLINAKTDLLIGQIQAEYKQTEEYITHEKHERITTLYAVNKVTFNQQYGYTGSSSKYDEIYDVYGNLMNTDKLETVKAEYKSRQEYEERSRSYQKDFYSNYNDNYSGGSSSYYNSSHSTHSEEDKENLKQFYRVLSKKFHPDSNPDTDTSKQMQLLNQLKDQWGI
jgi:hypothetical protein